MSSIEQPNIPTAPTLYGIDPTVQYKWTPAKFRQATADKLWARVWESIKGIKDDKEREIIIQRDYVAPLRGRRVAAPGSPVVLVGPLSSDVSLRLELANATYRNRLDMANRETAREIEAIKAKAIPEKRKALEIKEIERRAKDENAARGFASFDSDLIQEVLADAVRGWEGFVKPFVSWEESSKYLPAEDKCDLFWDIRSNNAWSNVEFESFESAPDLQQV